MDSHEYNGLVAEAARRQILRGPKWESPGGGKHHWKTRTARFGEDPRQWRVSVEPGTVNDHPAVITYLRNGDPRGWTMPDDYARKDEAARFYGNDFAIVDRRLTERQDPPFLLAETPAAIDENDAGDFERVPDDERRPESFRTRDTIERQLWKASVFVSATPARFSRVENRLHFPLPTKNVRYRVGLASGLPRNPGGVVQAGGTHELARLFCLRTPGQPELDEVFVQQRCFWSLWTTNISPFLAIDALGAVAGFPLIALGGVGAIGAATIAIGWDLLTDLVFREAAAGFQKPASVEFWTA